MSTSTSPAELSKRNRWRVDSWLPLADRVARRVVGAGYVLCALILWATLRADGSGTPLLEASDPSWSSTDTVALLGAFWIALGVGLVKGNVVVLLYVVLAYPGLVLLAGMGGSGPVGPDSQNAIQAGFWWLVAWVPFQFLAQVLTEGTLRSRPSGGGLTTLAYVAHLGVLVPATRLAAIQSFTRVRASVRRRRRRRAVPMPDGVARRYRGNAFHTLGLPPHEASARTVIRRRDEMQTLLRAGLSLTENIPGFFQVGWSEAGEGERAFATQPDLVAVTQAVVRLQNQSDRLLEELLWFNLEGEDTDVLTHLRHARFDQVRNTWNARREGGASGLDAHRTLQNLAVLAHHQAIVAEGQRARPRRLGDPVGWTQALALWGELLGSASWWNAFADGLVERSGNAVPAAEVEALRRGVALRVLGVQVDLAEAAANQGFIEYARQHVGLILDSPFEEEFRNAALHRLLAPRLAEARRVLLPYMRGGESLTADIDHAATGRELAPIRRELLLLGGEEQFSRLCDEAIRRACSRLRNEVDAAHGRFVSEDAGCYKVNHALVEQWNECMGAFNAAIRHGIAGLGLASRARADLQYVFHEFGARRAALEPVKQRLDDLDLRTTRAEQAIRFLESLVSSPTDPLRETLQAERANSRDALAHATQAFESTKNHVERNLSGMGQALTS